MGLLSEGTAGIEDRISYALSHMMERARHAETFILTKTIRCALLTGFTKHWLRGLTQMTKHEKAIQRGTIIAFG